MKIIFPQNEGLWMSIFFPKKYCIKIYMGSKHPQPDRSL